MTLLSALRPTRRKVIATVALGVLWLVALLLFGRVYCDCLPGGFEGCTDYYRLSLVRLGCHCGCWSLGRAMTDNLILVGPPAALYLVFSAVEWRVARRQQP